MFIKVGRISGDRVQIVNPPGDKKRVDEDEMTEAICIDQLDLSHNKIKYLPNLEHVCINKIKMPYNLLTNKQHLYISDASVYFMDYIDLQHNNITNMTFIISSQAFKQDFYTKQNSPNDYYMARMNRSLNATAIHTYIDLKLNALFECDCELMDKFKKYPHIQILNECIDDLAFQLSCENERRQSTSLNAKLRFIFWITCVLLVVLTTLLVYYMCSDCVKSFQPFERVHFCARQMLNRLKRTKLVPDVVGPAGNVRNNKTSSKAIYSKLDNELNSSNINLEINS